MSGVDQSERFPWRKVAGAAYVPTAAFAIGEGAVIPYIPLIAGDLGASLAVAAVVTAMLTVGQLAGDVPGGSVVARFGERPTMIGAGLLVLVALAIVYAIGISLVGIVHGSQASDDDGSAIFHVLGAGMAIISGNVVAIAVGFGVVRERPRSPYALTSIALGVIGLFGLAMLQIDAGTTTVDLLPDGVWERIAVYAVTAWQLMTGTVLLARKADGSEARVSPTRDGVTSMQR